MPVSLETAARADDRVNTPIIDEDAYHAQKDGQYLKPDPPSNTVEPGVVDSASQQGATQPGSGSEVPAQNITVPAHQPTFKEKVVGYAKEIRGKTLRNPETKEQGQRILSGEEVFEPKKVGPGARRASMSSDKASP